MSTITKTSTCWQSCCTGCRKTHSAPLTRAPEGCFSAPSDEGVSPLGRWRKAPEGCRLRLRNMREVSKMENTVLIAGER